MQGISKICKNDEEERQKQALANKKKPGADVTNKCHEYKKKAKLETDLYNDLKDSEDMADTAKARKLKDLLDDTDDNKSKYFYELQIEEVELCFSRFL